MKNLYISLISALLIITSACNKKLTPPIAKEAKGDGLLNIVFDNKISDQEVQFNQLNYTNAAGNLYSVSLLKYYVTQVVLHKKDGTTKALNNYDLIDAAKPESCIIEAGMMNEGEYDSISFNLGVDPSRNHSGNQDGDLDVSLGMFWTWNTGYIFFKHEGQYKNTANQTKALILHYATDPSLVRIKMPINLKIAGNKTMHILFDLNKVYTSPNNIDFNIDYSRQSNSGSDDVWMANTKSNLGDAFSFLKVD
jgi:hypothetical protein